MSGIADIRPESAVSGMRHDEFYGLRIRFSKAEAVDGPLVLGTASDLELFFLYLITLEYIFLYARRQEAHSTPLF